MSCAGIWHPMRGHKHVLHYRIVLDHLEVDDALPLRPVLLDQAAISYPYTHFLINYYTLSKPLPKSLNLKIIQFFIQNHK